jgi:hypothetical protein
MIMNIRYLIPSLLMIVLFVSIRAHGEDYNGDPNMLLPSGQLPAQALMAPPDEITSQNTSATVAAEPFTGCKDCIKAYNGSLTEQDLKSATAASEESEASN